MNPFEQEILDSIPQDQLLLMIFISIWELIWKGFALWKAANKKDNFWFILLLVFNTAGLLPALYIFYISKRKTKRQVMKIKLPQVVKRKEKEEKEEEPKKETKKKAKTFKKGK